MTGRDLAVHISTFWINGGLTVKNSGTALVFFVICIVGGFLSLRGQEELQKKIAIASDGETVDSKVVNQGARCHWILFFDEKGQLTEALENPYQQANREAGIKCTALLKDNNVTIFVAGNIGDKMAAALERSNIAFIAFTGSVEDAIKHVLENHARTKTEHPEF